MLNETFSLASRSCGNFFISIVWRPSIRFLKTQSFSRYSVGAEATEMNPRTVPGFGVFW